jgi:peptidyl-tRNA hydrolase, PTH1 family
VRLLAERHDVKLRTDRRVRASTGELRVDGRRVALAVPSTYMNESGGPVGALLRRYGIEDVAQVIVVHDELDLAPGRMKLKVGGGAAGHNGLKSVQRHVGDPGFVRVRVGIGKPPGTMTGVDYVLRRPGRADRLALEPALVDAADAVELLVRDGVAAAMNRYNRGDD